MRPEGPGAVPARQTRPLRALFDQAVHEAFDGLQPDELATVWFEAERTRFVRLTQARLRQAGSVDRPVAVLRLIRGQRQASLSQTLSGQADSDAAALRQALAVLRAALDAAGDDPHLLVARGQARSERTGPPDAPDALEVAQRLARAAQARALDLAGLVASGSLARGFASATAAGVEALHWFEEASTHVDYSIHDPDGRAVKSQLADGRLDGAAIEASIEQAARLADWLRRPPVPVEPGEHRALLEPAALAELLGMLQWDAFSLRAVRTRASPLARFHDGQQRFDPRVTLVEEPDAGGAPRFQPDGFALPPRLVLIDAGGPASLLASPRSAREFGVPANGAAAAESPVAMGLAAGDLPDDEALAALGTGLWIANLWYLNWSDRQDARVTGMTRFASFWVRNGQVAGPVAPLRFDDSLYRLLGDRLERLGAQARRLPDLSTYDGRATGAITAPSALLASLRIVS